MSDQELVERFRDFRKSTDSYAAHYVLHLLHAIEIVGYKHPDAHTRARWLGFYQVLVLAMHLSPETEAQLDERLNAGEEAFANREWCCDGQVKMEVS